MWLRVLLSVIAIGWKSNSSVRIGLPSEAACELGVAAIGGLLVPGAAWSSWGGSQRLACSSLRLYMALVVSASAAFSHQVRAWSSWGGSHWLASSTPRLYIATALPRGTR
jgi:hypothetical protein